MVSGLLDSRREEKAIALLGFSNLTSKCCPAFASILSTGESYLRELDLGFNNITDAAVKMLVKGMTSQNCRLEKLWLHCCGLTPQGCQYRALKIGVTLRELDLSGNDLGDSGLKHLANGLECLECHLEGLKLINRGLGAKSVAYLTGARKSNPKYFNELLLIGNKLSDADTRQLVQVTKNKKYALVTRDVSED
ncbi:ribonuclease inhibitor-like isoform X2 [Syngnathoides biaculeatus]|uniref:ribonuclease inhibitor-like isoform X2 n=1 Tax=Syngnathoides biaculeatus TaxID=300417 RepID=UPI002ADE1235|nr:ribonuclease inhibitor-like isoform X2 [Syngnathoides biaculeatus]